MPKLGLRCYKKQIVSSDEGMVAEWRIWDCGLSPLHLSLFWRMEFNVFFELVKSYHVRQYTDSIICSSFNLLFLYLVCNNSHAHLLVTTTTASYCHTDSKILAYTLYMLCVHICTQPESMQPRTVYVLI